MKTSHLFSAALLALAAGAAQAQTLQLNGDVDAAGCANGQFELGVVTTGTTTGLWSQHTTVDIGSARYMDLVTDQPVPDGAYSWALGDGNDTGTQTHAFPLPPATPFTVTITLRNAAGLPVYRTQGTVSPGCDATGTPPSVANIANTPLGGGNGGGGPVAVPTLGHAALALLGALVGGLGLRMRRRNS
ncbi:IPTL-CTERM sorting domain-containing protein [Acidovorax sp. SDU_ACID1]|uniref:IPTL-CTERM sorting domain-containing protein n=1 Tax=Acidovorax sp. SDU_ACID1 TaxID=3136632 RepID=UPI00387342BB